MKMKNPQSGQVLDIVRHLLLKNGWEVYITNQKDHELTLALVLGFGTDLGYINYPDYAGQAVYNTNLERVDPKTFAESSIYLMPAEDWKWVDVVYEEESDGRN